MAFDDLRPLARDYITQLAGNVVGGTHTADITRSSGGINDMRDRLVQKSAGQAEDHIIYFESYSSGDAFQTLIVRGYIKGEWLDPNTWQGAVQDSALEQYSAAQA
jgi:hypothetical protein